MKKPKVNFEEFSKNNGNLGKGNSGFENEGDSNSAYWNYGDRNTRECNIGNENTGPNNIGNGNSGGNNIGNCNTGFFNLGDCHTGIFNNKPQRMLCFNKPCNIKLWAWKEGVYRKLFFKFSLTTFVGRGFMSKKEKEKHPEYKTIGGYLKVVDIKTAYKVWWIKLNEEEKNLIKKLPNFDAEIFFEITGIIV